MFDVDQELRRFLAALADKKLVSRSCLDELESHLRDEIDDLAANGRTPEDAFLQATRTFGQAEDLLAEYAKLCGGSKLAKLRNFLSHYLDGRAVMKAFVGLVLGAAFMVVGLLLEGGHVASILQLTSFLLVLGTATGLSLLNVPWQQIVDAYADALKGKAAAPEVFRLIGRNFLNAGLVGAFVGFVQVVRYLRTPDEIGPALAISVVSILYGFLGYLFFGLGFEASFTAGCGVKETLTRPKKAVLPALLIVLAIFGSLRLGLGAERLKEFFNAPAALVVVAGILVVAAFIRRFDKVHLSYLANGALASGIVGCIFNFIHVMENLARPESVGVGLSVALLPILYAWLIAAALRSMSDQPGTVLPTGTDGTRPQTLMPYYVATVGVLLVSTGLVMYAA